MQRDGRTGLVARPGSLRSDTRRLQEPLEADRYLAAATPLRWHRPVPGMG